MVASGRSGVLQSADSRGKLDFGEVPRAAGEQRGDRAGRDAGVVLGAEEEAAAAGYRGAVAAVAAGAAHREPADVLRVGSCHVF